MKKIYTFIIYCFITTLLLNATNKIPFNIKNVNAPKNLIKVTNVDTKINKTLHSSLIKNKFLKDNDGGQVYGVDSIVITDGYGNLWGYEKYHYNNAGNIVEWDSYGYYYYVENGETIYIYILDQFANFEYDDDNNLIIYEQYSLDDNFEYYNGDIKQVFSYNSEGQKINLYEYVWDYVNYDWLESYAEISSYNSEGILSGSEYYNWTAFNEDWELFGKKEHFYDSLNNNTHSIEYVINDTGWIVTYWDTSIYENENLIQKIVYEYNPDDSSWFKIVNNEWTYTDGLNTKNIIQIWDNENEVWLGAKSEFTYNDYGWMIKEKYYEWLPDEGVYKLYFVYEIFWDKIQNLILLIPELTDNFEFNIYPNPVINYLNISNLNNKSIRVEYEIYNTLGNSIYKDYFIEQKQQIDLTSLQKGIYIIRFIIDDKEIVKKIIKQ